MYKDILLPIDLADGDSCKGSLAAAKEFADKFDSTLHVMTVIPDSGMSIVNQYFSKDAVGKVVEETNKALHRFVDKNISEDQYKVQHIVSSGNIYESIIEAAKKINADLIIMSAHRADLKDFLLGPNAARVVRHSDRSVLVVRDQ